MAPNLPNITILSLALVSLEAGAAGFGEISLHSRIGEPLRAEVTVAGGEDIDTACFSLANIRDSDLPVVTNARLKLIKDGSQSKLLISSSQFVSEPVFILSLRAGCGVELRRDFTLMPLAPVFTPQVAAVEVPVAWYPRPAAGRIWNSSKDESLETIAQTLADGDPDRQRRLLRKLKRNNPDLDPRSPLPEGTPVHLTRQPRPAANEAMAARPGPELMEVTGEVPSKPQRTTVAKRPALTPARSGSDRLVLDAPPADLARPAAPPRNTLPEMEERMLKLETTLHQLNQEMDKLNQALTLATEALVTQQKLQMAQSLQEPPSINRVSLPAPVLPPPEPPRPAFTNWLELTASAAVGGIIATLAAYFLGRLRQRQPISGSRPNGPTSAAPSLAPSPEPAPAPSLPWPPAPQTEYQDTFPPSAFGAVHFGTEAENIAVEENCSLLDVAKLMLSVGQIRGAADMLANHIEETKPDDLEPWLLLMDLYRRGDMRAEFEVLRKRLHAHFNFQSPGWEESDVAISGLQSLEDYPHVIRELVATWGTTACLEYLYHLVLDNRRGRRDGFPVEVAEEIALLIHILETAYGLKRSI